MASAVIKKLSSYVDLTPTIQTSAYSAKQIVGGLIELPAFFDSFGGLTELINITVTDASGQNVALVFCFFDSKPAGTYTDGAAFSPSSADLALIDTIVTVPSANYAAFTSNSAASVANIRAKISAAIATNQNAQNTKGKSAWLVVMTTGTPTYAAKALNWTINFEQDV